MRQHQPLRQVPRRFVWRRSVERHHRRGKTRRATKLRAPSVADGHDLDVVRTPANGFVEAMNCHVCLMSREVKRWQFYAPTFRDQAKRVAKPAQHVVIGTVSGGSSEKNLVWMGRLVVIIALIIAIMVNWQDTLGIGGKGGFEFIQKYTGYISPAIFPVFLFGFFWKKTTSKAAIAGIIGGVLLAVLFDKFLPGLAGHDTLIYTAYPTGTGAFEIPFLIQMGWVFFFTSVLIIVVSLLDAKGRALGNALQIDKSMYKVTPGVMAMIIIVLGIIVALYIRFW